MRCRNAVRVRLFFPRVFLSFDLSACGLRSNGCRRHLNGRARNIKHSSERVNTFRASDFALFTSCALYVKKWPPFDSYGLRKVNTNYMCARYLFHASSLFIRRNSTRHSLSVLFPRGIKLVIVLSPS